jgi:type II secretory pathway component PulF
LLTGEIKVGTKVIYSNIVLDNNKESVSLWAKFVSLFKNKLKESDLFLFVESISECLKINKDLVFCIESSMHFVKPKLQDIFRKIIKDIKKGQKFSTTLEQADVFPEYFISFVKVGEKNNNFEETFHFLKNFMNWKLNNNKKFVTALIYPVFTFAVFSIVLFLFADYVIPSLISALNEHNSINLNSFYNFVFAIKFIIFNIVLSIVAMFFIYHVNKDLFARIKYSIPFFGNFFMYKEIFFISYYLNSTLNSNLSIIQSFNICIDSSSIFVKKRLTKIRNDLIKGKKLSQSLQSLKFLDETIINFIKTGEKSSSLENSFLMINRTFEIKYRNFMERMIVTLPMALISCLSALIIAFLIFVFLPIYNMGF